MDILITITVYITGAIVSAIIILALISLLNKFILKKKLTTKRSFLTSLAFSEWICFFVLIVPTYKNMKAHFNTNYFFGKFIAGALIFTLISTTIIQYTVIKPFTHNVLSIFVVHGNSMYPSIIPNDFLIVKKYDLGNLQRGDIVVYQPYSSSKDELQYFVQRIIGVGEDTIKIEGGDVYHKSKGQTEYKKLHEKYLGIDSLGKTRGTEEENTYIVPKGKFFIMGDNRNRSSDSRTCFSYSCNATENDNFIDYKNIAGKLIKNFGQSEWFSSIHK